MTTTGGEWDTDVYDLKQDENQGPRPPAENWRGVDITLKFKPSNLVDAELIGLSQSVTSVVGGKTNLTPGAAARPIPAADAKPRARAETDEGTAIDQSPSNTNPIYAVENAASTNLADASDPRFGENGWHYKDAKGVLQEKTGKLMDAPPREREQGLRRPRDHRAGHQGHAGRDLLRLRALGLAHRRGRRVSPRSTWSRSPRACRPRPS